MRLGKSGRSSQLWGLSPNTPPAGRTAHGSAPRGIRADAAESRDCHSPTVQPQPTRSRACRHPAAQAARQVRRNRRPTCSRRSPRALRGRGRGAGGVGRLGHVRIAGTVQDHRQQHRAAQAQRDRQNQRRRHGDAADPQRAVHRMPALAAGKSAGGHDGGRKPPDRPGPARRARPRRTLVIGQRNRLQPRQEARRNRHVAQQFVHTLIARPAAGP